MAVVVALELDEAVLAGGRARHAQGRHRGLRAGVDHADSLQGGNHLAQQLGHGHLARRRRAEAQALGRGLLHGLDDLRVGVAADHRAPGAHVVDVALAVDVEHVGAFGVLEEDRLAAHGRKGANGRVDPAGNAGAGAVEEVVAGGHGVSNYSWNGRNWKMDSGGQFKASPLRPRRASSLPPAGRSFRMRGCCPHTDFNA